MYWNNHKVCSYTNTVFVKLIARVAYSEGLGGRKDTKVLLILFMYHHKLTKGHESHLVSFHKSRRNAIYPLGRERKISTGYFFLSYSSFGWFENHQFSLKFLESTCYVDVSHKNCIVIFLSFQLHDNSWKSSNLWHSLLRSKGRH